MTRVRHKTKNKKNQTGRTKRKPNRKNKQEKLRQEKPRRNQTAPGLTSPPFIFFACHFLFLAVIPSEAEGPASYFFFLLCLVFCFSFLAYKKRKDAPPSVVWLWRKLTSCAVRTPRCEGWIPTLYRICRVSYGSS
jgi:hypothetical protein